MTAAVGPDVVDPADANPLITMLQRCVVRIRRDGRFSGTGFFIAPGEVLTCAHVVHGGVRITVDWDTASSLAYVLVALPRLDVGDPRARFFPFPDVALLRLNRPPDWHPCVQLDLTEPAAGPPASVLRLAAWTRDEYAPDCEVLTSGTAEFEGPLHAGGNRLLKLKNGQITHGFSGAPLLNVATGGVCGIIDSTRDARSDLGGFGVPLATFLDSLPGLTDRNRIHHQNDQTWRQAVQREAQLVAQRASEWHQLPLTEPLLTLDWDASGSRADLLHPRYGIVPFLGRSALLTNLMLWRESSDRLRLVVIAGAGGFGKTRTAVEVCAAAGRAGWTAGLLSLVNDDPGEKLHTLSQWPGRLIVAIDYAETRPGIVGELLVNLHARRHESPVRVILVTRQVSTKPELRQLFATGDARPELTGLIQGADVVRLDRDVHEVDRLDLFEQASNAFSARVSVRRLSSKTPALTAEHFSRPLYVLVAALLAVEDPSLDVDDLAADDLLVEVLDRHEAEYWDRWNRRLRTGLTRQDQRRAVALAALLGAETASDAVAVVQMLPGFADSSGERLREVATWLAHLYGSGRLDTRPAISPLEPDLLAEALIERELVSGESH